MKGLKLDLRASGGDVSARLCLGDGYESSPGTVHGDIIAAVLDEVMAGAAREASGLHATIAGMRLRHLQAMRSNVPHLAQATVTWSDGKQVRVEGQLSAASGGLVAVAEATFLLRWREALSAKT
jgi:acyl-coenzyme A thioesterase PaaI-like protein